VDFGAVVDFTPALRAAGVSPHRSVDSRLPLLSLATTPAPLADLIMEESQEASPLAGNRASVEVSTEAEDFTAAVVTGKSVRLQT